MKVGCSCVLFLAVSAYAYVPLVFIRDVFLETWAVNEKIPNIAVSPYSLVAPLGTLVLGSEGTTQEQILKALNVPITSLMSDLHSTSKQRLTEVNHVVISTSNRLYISSRETLLPEFNSAAQHIYDVDIQSVDFSNPEKIAKDINQWVEKKTDNRIKNLTVPSSLKPTTPAVLVNTIYIDGKWRKRFENSVNKTFYADNSKTMIVPTMTIKTRMNYGYDEELEAEVVKVPYEDEYCFFAVVLPKNNTKVDNLKTKLKNNKEVIDIALVETSEAIIELSMPVFEIETQTDLKIVLEKLNIKEIFSSKAKLTMMEGDSNLFIESAIQKAYIKVNEEGTQVAAAKPYDIPSFLVTSAPPKNKVVVDRPFYFEIKCADITLLNGIVREP